MKHSFTPSIGNTLVCVNCKKDAVSHTDMAICECCENVGPVEIMYGSILMCESCQNKEIQAEKDRKDPIIQQQRVDVMNTAIEASRSVDNSITVRTDLFNAATVSIIELCKSIDEDATISNKPYAKAEELKNRFLKFQTVIFDLNEKLVEAGNQQKAIQTYLNTLAVQLKSEEREKLKIKDINYQPQPVKSKSPKPIKTSGTVVSRGSSKVELTKWATEIGVPEYTLKMLMVSKGITAEAAAKLLKASLDAARGM